MQICHISDNHGNFPELKGSFDCVINTGDFCKDPPKISFLKEANANYQKHWLNQNISKIKSWLNEKAFLFVLGNHDFISADVMEQMLKENGIEAYSLENKIVNFKGKKIYGFPYVPFINGSFNYEKHQPEMLEEVQKMMEIISKEKINILAAHAPLYGCLDLHRGINLGNAIMANALNYMDQAYLPKVYLCGHIHQAHGIATILSKMLVSNAATTQHIIGGF